MAPRRAPARLRRVRALRGLVIPLVLTLGGIGLAFAGLAITLDADEDAYVRNFHATSLSYFGSLLSLLSLGWFAASRLGGAPRRLGLAVGALLAAASLAFALVPFVQSYSDRPDTLRQTAWRGLATGFSLAALGWFMLSRPLPARTARLAGTALGLTAFAFGLTGIVELFTSNRIAEMHGYRWLAFGFDLAILAAAARAAARPAAEP